jgi:hypothetical protein
VEWHMCDSCAKSAANSDQWVACCQVHTHSAPVALMHAEPSFVKCAAQRSLWKFKAGPWVACTGWCLSPLAGRCTRTTINERLQCCSEQPSEQAEAMGVEGWVLRDGC